MKTLFSAAAAALIGLSVASAQVIPSAADATLNSAMAPAPPQQGSSEVLARLKEMEDRIKFLEAEVQSLKAQRAAVAPVQDQPSSPPLAAAPQPALAMRQPLPTPQYGGAGPAAAKAFNPDISVIGDFLGGVGSSANRPSPALEMHETEVGFQSIIDPYARADIFLSFGEHGVDLEEGYLTFTSLPGALQLRAGKMRAAFGKVNTIHNHVLPWTDRPLVTRNLVAGEEGISDAGLSLSRILPAPKGIFLEGIGQVFRGDSEGVFGSQRRGDVSTVGHLRGYRDLSESTNIDLGLSYARGHSPLGQGVNQLYGMEATLHWKPLRRAIYHSFIARGEFIWAHSQFLDVTESNQNPILTKPFGYYVSSDYQLGRRWFLGARFDRSDRPAKTLLTDTGASLLLTYWPSEFSQVRGQFRRTHYGENLTANELLFQIQFSMGAHGAHPF